ncbi:Gfo/Idh/MocA family oxidoreductase [Clostridium sp.]|uniref:Gfo/Idh/MocA family protein n=1 Tax=Clostridium sp. TaxID=1506 RepID=UPI001A49538D|nr:Gfo/Idh/MocA family oxidoreductase [Clostridium sp.]MBK5241011.1 Gfo/Idh/MocA family oxidoreductase [Clostridium sp.]
MIRIGVICPSEIALRRFMPALKSTTEFEYVGIAVCTVEERFGEKTLDVPLGVRKSVLKAEHDKAASFVEVYGGKVFDGYQTIATSDEIDALYIPLPPSLHYKWAKIALASGKHVLIEKPSTTDVATSVELAILAEEKGLALHENYMFAFHDQLIAINELVESGEIGGIRVYRLSFGFPRRAANDFRYNKDLGGGALMDAGGYTIKYGSMLLGKTARIAYAQLNYIDEFEVDIYGSAVMVNDKGTTVQISFGMDNDYKCELEVWGSKGSLTAGRVFTAPVGFVPQMSIRKENTDEVRKLPADDTFEKSILRFQECIKNKDVRKENYQVLVKQATLIDEFLRMARK